MFEILGYIIDGKLILSIIHRTNTLGWSIGEIREFDSIELGKWHECIMKVIHKTSAEISKKFVQVPDYPE